MNKQPFQYSVLRYRHSYFLAEEVNVGILFYFPAVGRVEFLYPSRLQRISGLYPDFNINTLRKFLHAFEKQAEKLTKRFIGNSDLFENAGLQAIIEDFFLKEDATALFFSEIKKGTYDNVDQILRYYQNQYLSVYDKDAGRNRKDEEYIVNKVEEGLKATNINHSKDIKREYTLETPYLSQQFDLAWQNETTHLVTPIGLDLKRKESIERKASTWRGRLEIFQAKAKEDNLAFDLIISRPEDRNLFRTYDNVLKILEDNKAPKKLYELENLPTYIEHLSSNIRNK